MIRLHVFACVLACGALLRAQVAGAATEPRLVLPDSALRYATPLPAHFVASDIEAFDTNPASAPMHDAVITLGRVLFHDRRLSGNATTSCASCHVQQHAFSDPRRFSVGFAGQRTDRNSMSLVELRWQRAHLFWDERARTLEDAVMVPLYSHVEMGSSPQHLRETIAADERYAPLFNAAFGTPEPDEKRVATALAQFVRAIDATRSRFDAAAAKAQSFEDEFADFTPSENLGKRLFVQRCAACHSVGQQKMKAVFSMFRSLNNGIDADAGARDGGRGDVTFNPTEFGDFKASSLRNVEFTAPYMHDGRMATLADVIEHYSTGVMRHPTLGAIARMNFGDDEKAALLDFLKTLSDHSLPTDERFTDPWRWPADAVPAALARSDAAATAPNGLDPEATRAWLAGLDTDHDGRLAAAELRPLARLLIDSDGVEMLARGNADPRRGEGRGRGRNARARPARDDGSPPPPEADLDGDGTTSPDEDRVHAALARLVTLQDGGRLEVLLDRALAPLPVSNERRLALRRSIVDAKRRQNAAIAELDAATMAGFERITGADAVARFASAVVRAMATERPAAAARAVAAEPDAVVARLLELDTDGDGSLDATEQQPLLAQLVAFPGGLGRRPAAPPEVEQVATRLLAFDQDGDGAVSLPELPERMAHFVADGDGDRDGRLTLAEAKRQLTNRAFAAVLAEGVYIGGAFRDALVHHRSRIGELDLDAAVAAEADALFEAHAQAIDERTAATLAGVLGDVHRELAAR